MDSTKQAVISISEISKEIIANGLVGSRILKSTPDNERYNNIVPPAVAEYKIRFEQSPEKYLETLLYAYLATRSVTVDFEAEGMPFFGRVVRAYVWAAITPKYPKKVEVKVSHFPQLYVLVGDFGVKFGFDYGYNVPEDKRSVTIVATDKDASDQVYRALSMDHDLGFYPKDDNSMKEERPGIAYRPESVEDLRSHWSRDVHIMKWFPADSVPEDIQEEIFKTFDLLLPLFKIVSSHRGDPPANYIVQLEEKGRIEKPPEIPPRKEPVQRQLKEMYGLEDFCIEAGYSRERAETWLRALSRKRQVIFQGPPGTGKTFLANKLAKLIISDSDGLTETIQFHPSFAYEDFIRGLRPKSGPNGISYELVDGQFLKFCSKARKRKGPCVLIIDEINRANLSRVFGELIYLLEYREREIPLASGGEMFSIPNNVLIIGTMNTADRSIALVDYALRRRFDFFRLEPDYGLLEKRLKDQGLPSEALISVLREINESVIRDPNYSLGISYFIKDVNNLKRDIQDIWTGEIEPLLEEIFYDDLERVNPYRWATLSKTTLKEWSV
ncbi:MAG: AAA family ATPase [Methanomassiliicoccus sp.]|nr:AAA family ATPase [Methanomassiliicoccus sp.]